MPTHLWQLDATDLAQKIPTRQASAHEATSSVLGRIAAVNPTLNAVVRVLADEGPITPIDPRQ